MGRVTRTGSSPGFVADHGSVARSTGRQIDWTVISESYRSTAFTVKITAAALIDATSIAVVALPQALNVGEALYFGALKKLALVTAYAAKGATTVTVQGVPTALAVNDEAVVGGVGAKRIKSGTIMSELANGKIAPRKIATQTAIGLLIADAEEDAKQDAITGNGLFIGGVFYRELLPDRSDASFNTWVGEINTAGPGIRLETFSDSRAV